MYLSVSREDWTAREARKRFPVRGGARHRLADCKRWIRGYL